MSHIEIEQRLAVLRSEQERDQALYERLEAQLAHIQRTMDMRHGGMVELEALLAHYKQNTEEHHGSTSDSIPSALPSDE